MKVLSYFFRPSVQEPLKLERVVYAVPSCPLRPVTFGFIGEGGTELPDLALELAHLGVLIPEEALGDRFAALSRRFAWD